MYRHVLTVIFTAILTLTYPQKNLLAQPINLPDIGDSAATVMTPEEEHRVGETVVRNIRRKGGILDDPLATEYINQLGYRLISHSDARQKDFTFFIVNDPAINAFALPGGFIGINYGLILSAQSESELASVMAHEIVHVTQRHHARAYQAASRQSIPAVAALLAAMVLASNNSEVGQAALTSLAAKNLQDRIDFTRENEKEADHIGINLLADSGFDPYSMAVFFDTLQKQTRLYGPQAPEFLRTHPVSENRVAEARLRAAQYPRAQLQSDNDFHLVRSRLRVINSNNPKLTLERFEKNLSSGRYTHKNTELYGYALSLMENANYVKAGQVLRRLLKEEPHRIAYLLAEAQLKQLSGKTKQSLQDYQTALAMYPANEALSLAYIKTLVDLKKANTAKKALTPLLNKKGPNPAFFLLQAQAEELLGNGSNQHEALAEYYYLVGMNHQALTQIKLALADNKTDFYQRTRLEARLKDINEEIGTAGH